MEETKLQLISLHNINLDSENVISRNIEINDAQDYVLTLSNRMMSYKNIREYNIKSLTTEVVSQIITICTSFTTYALSALTTQDAKPYSYSEVYDIIVQRLLREQIDARRKYQQLTNIKNGNLIQSLLETDEEYIYLIALVEHNKFIDNSDFKYKIGMPDDDKVALKSARFHLTKDGTIKKIYLTDSSPKISDYWYDGFLDLSEAKDNIANTKFAYNAIETILRNTLSSKYSTDYNELKNALNIYFTHNECYTHNACIGFLLDSYEPFGNDFDKDTLKKKLTDCISNYDFDTAFSIDTTAIKSKLKNRKYKVNSNIELNIKNPIEKMEENIYTDKLSTEEKVLIIKNVDEKILKQFNFKNIDL
jgi:hypothetical protein